jgi:MFS family permease
MPRRPFYGWIVVAIAFVTLAVGVNARTAFSLFLPPILDEFGWDRGLAAGAFSFGFLVSAGLSLIVGRLMDRYGPRAVMELGVALMAAGLLLAYFVSEPWHLYLTLGMLVGGGSNCMGYTGQSLFLPNWFVRRRAFAIGIAFSGAGVGSILLLPALQAIIEQAGWRTACLALGALVVALLAPLNLLLRKRPEDMGLHPDGDPAPAPGSPRRGGLRIVDPAWAAVDWTLARALRTARFWWAALGYFGALYVWYAVQVHQTQFLIEVGFGATEAAWALGFVSFVAVPGQIALGHLADRIGREWVWSISCAGFAACCIALLALQRTPSPALLWAMIVAQGLLGYGLTSVMGAIAAELFEGRHFGAIFSAQMLAMILGGALGPWLTGALHDSTGSYAPGFAIALAVSGVSAAAMWMAAPRKVRAVAARTQPV